MNDNTTTETRTDLPPLPEWLAEYDTTQHVFTTEPAPKHPWLSATRLTAFAGAALLAISVVLTMTTTDTGATAKQEPSAKIGADSAANAGR